MVRYKTATKRSVVFIAFSTSVHVSYACLHREHIASEVPVKGYGLRKTSTSERANCMVSVLLIGWYGIILHFADACMQ